MGIYIKSMEMPTGDEMLCINIFPDGKVTSHFDLRCMSVAKAVPVPPHGDLVDRKVAFDYWLCAANDFCWSPTDENFKKALEATPTIIPADVPDNNVGNIPAEEG